MLQAIRLRKSTLLSYTFCSRYLHIQDNKHLFEILKYRAVWNCFLTLRHNYFEWIQNRETNGLLQFVTILWYAPLKMGLGIEVQSWIWDPENKYGEEVWWVHLQVDQLRKHEQLERHHFVLGSWWSDNRWQHVSFWSGTQDWSRVG